MCDTIFVLGSAAVVCVCDRYCVLALPARHDNREITRNPRGANELENPADMIVEGLPAELWVNLNIDILYLPISVRNDVGDFLIACQHWVICIGLIVGTEMLESDKNPIVVRLMHVVHF